MTPEQADRVIDIALRHTLSEWLADHGVYSNENSAFVAGRARRIWERLKEPFWVSWDLMNESVTPDEIVLHMIEQGISVEHIPEDFGRLFGAISMGETPYIAVHYVLEPGPEAGEGYVRVGVVEWVSNRPVHVIEEWAPWGSSATEYEEASLADLVRDYKAPLAIELFVRGLGYRPYLFLGPALPPGVSFEAVDPRSFFAEAFPDVANR